MQIDKRAIICITCIVVGFTLLHFLTSKKTGPITVSSEPDQHSLEPKLAKPISLLFGGDLMFDRDIRRAMEKNSVDFVLAPLTQFFSTHDLVIANLEGPVTTHSSLSVGTTPGEALNFIFTFDPNILPMLKKNKLELVSIGNNHIRNFGSVGVEETKSLLTKNQLTYFGNTGQETSPTERVAFKEYNNLRLAFINHNQFVDNGFATALEDLDYAANSADILIVMTHWGNEYQPKASGVIVDQAHQLIEHGADLVIGTHPHVVQQSEVYLGKHIYYSLGNLVFDQYFSKETKQGLLVQVTIHDKDNVAFKEFPVILHPNGQTSLVPEE